MIIPVKCFTCGHVLADKYRYFQDLLIDIDIDISQILLIDIDIDIDIFQNHHIDIDINI